MNLVVKVFICVYLFVYMAMRINIISVLVGAYCLSKLNSIQVIPTIVVSKDGMAWWINLFPTSPHP